MSKHFSSNYRNIYMNIIWTGLVTDHYKNIMGVPTNKIDMKNMQRVLRFFGYYVFAVMTACFAIFIVMYLFQFCNVQLMLK